jgi:hypothetical protein
MENWMISCDPWSSMFIWIIEGSCIIMEIYV